jgi:hypothetical protein
MKPWEGILKSHNTMFYQNILLIGIFRHLVASRTIEAGTIILKENPLIFGPQGSKPICLGCCQIVTEKSPRCEKCGFPLCSKACADSEMHKTFECEPLMMIGYFKTLPIDNFFKAPEVYYKIIVLLRTFLLREKDPERWALIWNLESHKTEQEELIFDPVRCLVKLLQITSGLLEEDIHTITTIMCILNVNQFGCGTIKHKPAGILFGLASMSMHDCLANTSNYISLAEEGFIMSFKALRTIKEGEPITITYNDPLTTVLERQDAIAGKFFMVSISL